MADVRQVDVNGFGEKGEVIPARSAVMNGWRIAVLALNRQFSLDLGGGGVVETVDGDSRVVWERVNVVQKFVNWRGPQAPPCYYPLV